MMDRSPSKTQTLPRRPITSACCLVLCAALMPSSSSGQERVARYDDKGFWIDYGGENSTRYVFTGNVTSQVAGELRPQQLAQYLAAHTFQVYTTDQIDDRFKAEHAQADASGSDFRQEIRGIVSAAFSGVQEQALSPDFQQRIVDAVLQRLEDKLAERDASLRASIMSDVRKLIANGGQPAR